MLKPVASEQLKYWFALLRIPGIGCRTFNRILQQCSPQQFFNLSVIDYQQIGLRQSSIDALQAPDWERVALDLAWLDQDNNSVLTIQDSCYPAQLKEISDPPPVLFICGDPELLASAQIAVVGSRNPSNDGSRIAVEFAEELSRHGFVITSGLALGIDTAGHRGALNVGGKTIAVAGTGLDRVYPAKNRLLAREIAENGVLVSEFLPGTAANANHFPRRNRIISGLCMGLLVVEAAQRSGSLITARMALEQNREVFAIPGSINNPLAKGCNALIKEGAKLVESSNDIFEELSQYNQQDTSKPIENIQTVLDQEQQNLLNHVQFSPTSMDCLVEVSGVSVEAISSMLLLLELNGCIESVPGGYIRIK